MRARRRPSPCTHLCAGCCTHMRELTHQGVERAILVRASGGRRGPPEAPCAAPQCGNGAPAPLVSASTNFPIKLG